MPESYRVFVLSKTGAILARHDFTAESDDVVEIAKTTAEACSHLCARVEVWQRERLIFSLPVVKADGPWVANTLAQRTQIHVTMMDERLLQSR